MLAVSIVFAISFNEAMMTEQGKTLCLAAHLSFINVFWSCLNQIDLVPDFLLEPGLLLCSRCRGCGSRPSRRRIRIRKCFRLHVTCSFSTKMAKSHRKVAFRQKMHDSSGQDHESTCVDTK